jgi:hypothetical protein
VRRSFALNTEPHVAEIGDVELRFEPEVMGDEFMEAYARLRAAQKDRGVDLENLDEADPLALRHTMRAVRQFLAEQMLPESAERFTRLDVVEGGTVLESFQDLNDAADFAARHEGSQIVDALRLPTRVLTELLEWVVELYGGGERPTTSSSGSATPSPRVGTRGTGVSPSKASTRTRGR